MNAIRVLRLALYAGALYFLGISTCHAAGWKIPGFYIYFDVSSMPYQDWIISLLAFGWATFFYVAARLIPAQTLPVQAILLSSVVALVSLARINLQTNFDLLGASANTGIYWLELAALILYLGILIFFYFQISRTQQT